MSETMLEPGSLWPALQARAEHALRCGALEPIATERAEVEEAGIRFVVRVLGQLERKVRAGFAQARTGANPFLPYNEALFVANVSQTHLCLLNKFNELDHHLLLVTRAFEEQENLLAASDFEALATCMAEFDALGFYNSDAVAGASQRHKHLQLVPVPLGAGPERLPVDGVLADGRLPFVHAAERVDAFDGAALQGTYRQLLRALQIEGLEGEARASSSYNLLVTREWMVLVPRERHEVEGVPVNALGFGGALLVRNRQQLAELRRRGPFELLRQAGRPRG
ncbi:MAG: phosphorylase [Deltaproteobacteria bacterium]|nr:phosphorylase [Deltaproteobacteria bacterium]